MHLLFDLDGTLTDSRPGIIRCFQHALGRLGREIPADSVLNGLVGPPLAHCFGTLLGRTDEALVEQAIAAYRERFVRVGMFESTLYPFVRETLDTLSTAHLVYVVTVKPRVYAQQILDHFGLSRLFAGVHGPELGDRHFDKGSLIALALQRHAIAPSTALMIGDRGEDATAARANGVRSVAVTWGYGSRQELESAVPDRLVDSTAQLIDDVDAFSGRTRL